MNTYFLLTALMLGGSCAPSANSHSVRGRLPQLVCELQTVDLETTHVTQWALMHMQLVLGPQDTVLIGGELIPLETALRSPRVPFQTELLSDPQPTYRVRRGSYQYEYEDHYAQSAFYWALGCYHYRHRFATSMTADELDRVRWMCINRPSEEPTWILGLASLACAQASRDRSIHAAQLAQSLDEMVRQLVNTRVSLSCGGCHAAVALSLARQSGVLRADTSAALDVWLNDFGRIVSNNRDEDGYVRFPGLDDTLGKTKPYERIRVLAHVVEGIAFAIRPLSEGDYRTIGLLCDLVQDAGVGSLDARTLGDLCHGLSGLMYIESLGVHH